MFFMMGITDGRKQLDFTQTVICSVCGKYGGTRSLWRIRCCRYFLSHAWSGTGTIMCRWAAAIRCMSLIRKSERRLRVGNRWRFCCSIWRWCSREPVDMDTGIAIIAVMRQQKILSIARSAETGFRKIWASDSKKWIWRLFWLLSIPKQLLMS